MMNSNEFHEWSKELNLSEEAIEQIKIIRLSDPSRLVGGGARNVPGEFTSKKMGVTIQFESSKVELAAIYMMEFDDNVLEFYDQPPSIKLNKVGWKTPDFFVIEKDRAYWIEWKTEDELIKLSQKKNAKYYLDEESNWRYLPGEEYCKSLGIEFKVGSSKDINWTLQRNLIYLKDYLGSEKPNEEVISSVKNNIMASPGITLKKLIDSSGEDFTLDDINILIAQDILYVDLFTSLLVEPSSVKIYCTKEQNRSFINLWESSREKKEVSVVKITNGSKILWGEIQWKILNHDIKNLFLVSDSGDYNEVPIETFERYVSEGYITGLNSDDDIDDEKVKELITTAAEADLKIANRKYSIVKKILQGDEIGPIKETDRTIRNWIKAYRDAEDLYGNGYLGLLPNDKNKGNRNRKIPTKSIELMEEVINESYESIKIKTAKVVHGEYQTLCENNKVPPASYQTFCEAIRKRSIFELTKSREGDRAAYKYEEFYWSLEYTTPKHGDRAFEIAHIDHTLLDIELDIGNGKSKKPWCTFLTDAFSRRILAFYLTFDSPCISSNMMIIRECVRKYNRLPQTLVVDGGRDFHSIYFESLLAMYEVEKKTRPAAKARFGSVVERLFGIANKLLIHNLLGNTQVMKNVRQVTKQVNPKNHAVWNLELLTERLENWIDEVYDIREHPAHFMTPKDAFNHSIASTGKRFTRLIPYNEEFIILTLPSPKPRHRKVHPGKGIKLNYYYYSNDKFRNREIENSMVEVRYDPFNIGVAYAYVNKRWEKCYSEYYSIVNGKTEKQIKLITEELRHKRKEFEKNSSITAKMIAEFILESEEIENRLLLEKQGKSIDAVQLTLIEGTGKNDDMLNKRPDKTDVNFFDDDMDLVFLGRDN
nr:TnsA endonuclease N-terminal domain-containing protein [Bacillus sp. MB2021]